MAISPFTKPGTIVAINTTVDPEMIFTSNPTPNVPERGVPLILVDIIMLRWCLYARVKETEMVISLDVLDYLTLPKSITEILDKADKPIDGVSPELETVDG